MTARAAYTFAYVINGVVGQAVLRAAVEYPAPWCQADASRRGARNSLWHKEIGGSQQLWSEWSLVVSGVV
jgi:hypothetical protein